MLFMTWSGLDGVGMVIMTIFQQGNFTMGNTEGWLDYVISSDRYGYQYSMNETLLSWVYNQAIAPWIAVPLFLENKKVRNFAFLGLCIFPFAPLPFFGLAIMMIAAAVFL